MSSIGSVEDRLAIRELCEAFGSAVMHRDAEAWADTWAEDGVWAVAPGIELSGRSAIVAGWQAAMGTLDFCAFFGAPGPLVVTGDTARGAFAREERLYLKNGSVRTIIGRYDDEYVKRDGRWRLARRASETYRDTTA